MTVAAEPVNIAAMAKRLRRTRRTIYNWQQNGCPIEEGDEAVLAWVAARKESRESDADEAVDLRERKLLAECAKLEAEVEAKNLKNEIARGEVANIDEITAELSERLIHAKALLESMVDEIAKESAEGDRVKNKEIAKHAADRFYRKLANYRPEKPLDS